MFNVNIKLIRVSAAQRQSNIVPMPCADQADVTNSIVVSRQLVSGSWHLGSCVSYMAARSA
eukprot:281350-Alexandrium_andersonii.AAC.1